MAIKAYSFQLPIGSEDNFNGIVDIIMQKAYSFDGKNVKECPIPDELKDDVENYWSALVEATSENKMMIF